MTAADKSEDYGVTSDFHRQRREARTQLASGLLLLGAGMATTCVGLSSLEMGAVVTIFGLGIVLVSYFLIVTGIAALEMLGWRAAQGLPQQEQHDRTGGETPS